MGCCMSTSNSKGSSSPKDSAPRSSISRVKATENRAPPPPLEEETVKEVLSETPKWKPKFEAEKPPQKPSFDKKLEGESKVEKNAMALGINKGTEEISEICSLSESVSTTTVTDMRDEEEETRQRVHRSPAKMHKNRSFSGDFGGGRRGKSPARRSEQSPSRRNVGSVRVVRGIDQMGNGVTRNQTRGGVDNSGRRSRSPATRVDNEATRSVVGRSPSARRTNQSPARVRTAAPKNGDRKKESPTVEGNWQSESANESLENPLVSLECFIFL